MKEIRKTAEYIQNLLNESKVDKYAFALHEKETREFNADLGDFSLFRTVFGNNAAVTVYNDNKMGTKAGNDFSDEALKTTVDEAILSAQSAVEDPAYDIAEKQPSEVFHYGCYEPDIEKFFSRVEELLSDIKAQYPKVKILNVFASHTKDHALYMNSNGTDFEDFGGSYSVNIEFSGNDGEKTTGLDYADVTTANLDKPFIDLGSFRVHLESAQNQLNLTSFEGKFEGTVLFTPDCFAQFVAYTLNNYVSSSVILDGTSLWLDKIGQQVADPRITISMNSSDPRIVEGETYTADGYRTQDVDIIKDGVLKNHLIGLYLANKTGRPVTKNTSSDIVIAPGSDSYADIVASIDRGLLVGGFSGGQPGTNGEFSGVAKNSYYIENGQIKGAVSETMINGNLGDMLKNVKAISKEVVCDGSMVIPYVAVNGIVISSK